MISGFCRLALVWVIVAAAIGIGVAPNKASATALTNGGFESDLTGWTIVNQRVDLGVDRLGGCPTRDTTDYAAIWSRKQGFSNDPAPVDDDGGIQAGRGGTLTTETRTSYESRLRETFSPSEGSKMLRLSWQGVWSAQGYDVLHGPAIVSPTFSATSGEVITFDWQAAYEDDDFAVLGYLLDQSSCTQYEIVDATGRNSSDMLPIGTGAGWQRASVTIPSTQTDWIFVFVSGTYDRSGGRALGATMLIDNISVGQPQTIAFPQPADRGMGSFTPTATPDTNSGLTVKFTSSTPTKCTVDANGTTVNLIATGTCTLTASADGGSKGGVTYAPSNQVTRSFTVLSVTTPDAPTITGATPSFYSSLVSFSDPASDGGAPVIDYQINYRPVGESGSWTSVGSTTSPIEITGLDPQTEYEVELKAENSQGAGAASNSVTFTTSGAPTITEVTYDKDRSQVFFEAAPVGSGGNPIIGYEINWRLKGSDSSSWTSIPGSSFRFNLGRLVPREWYEIEIRARDEVGSGPASNRVLFRAVTERPAGPDRPERTTTVPETTVPLTVFPTLPTTTIPETTLPVASSTVPATLRPTLPDNTLPAAPITFVPDSLPSIPPGSSVVVEEGTPVPVTVEEVEPGTWEMKGSGFEWQLRIPDADTPGSSRGVVTLVRNRDVEVNGSGFLPGSLVDVWLFSTPIFIGTVRVGPDGSFEGRLDLPSGVSVGAHTLQANGLTPDQKQRSLNLGVQVLGSVELPVTGVSGSDTRGVALLLLVGGAAIVGLSRRLQRSTREM